ncbi:MAG TPA: hypothetical protein VGE72_30435 [Azospirillum sp.]
MDKSELILAAIEQMGRSISAEFADIRAKMAAKDDLKDLRVELKEDLKDLRIELKEDLGQVERRLKSDIETVDNHSEGRFNSIVTSLIQLSKLEGRIEEQSKILQLALAGRMQRPPAAE